MLERYLLVGAFGDGYESAYAFDIPLLMGEDRQSYDLILFGRVWNDDRARLAAKIEQIESMFRNSIDDVLAPNVRKLIVPNFDIESDVAKRDEALACGLKELHDVYMEMMGLKNCIDAKWTLRPYLLKRAKDLQYSLLVGEECWNLPWEGSADDDRVDCGFLMRNDWDNNETACFIQCLCEQNKTEAVRREAYYHSKSLRLLIDYIAKEGNTSLAHAALNEWEMESFYDIARNNSLLVTQVTCFPQIDCTIENSGKTWGAPAECGAAVGEHVTAVISCAENFAWNVEIRQDTVCLHPPIDNTCCVVEIRKDAPLSDIMEAMLSCLCHHPYDDVGIALKKLVISTSNTTL